MENIVDPLDPLQERQDSADIHPCMFLTIEIIPLDPSQTQTCPAVLKPCSRPASSNTHTHKHTRAHSSPAVWPAAKDVIDRPYLAKWRS